MIEHIKRAALAAWEASGPVAVQFGTVVRDDPLEVYVDQRFTIDADFLVVPESLTRLELDLRHRHDLPAGAGGGATGEALTEPVVVRPGLKAGDRVVLLRMQGGQQYLILDKVVSG